MSTRAVSIAILALWVWFSVSARSQSTFQRYSGPETVAGPETIHTQYFSLAQSPRIEVVAPLSPETTFNVAALVKGLFNDERIEFVPQNRFPIGEDKWAVFYGMRYQGVPLATVAEKMLLLRNDGQPLEFRDRNRPEILPETTKPTVAVESAVNLAVNHLRQFLARSGSRIPPSLALNQPQPRLEIWVENRTGILCWELLIRPKDERVRLAVEYWISATGDPRVVAVKDHVYSAHHGKVVGTVLLSSSFAGSTQQIPLGGAEITRMNSGDDTISNVDGTFRFPGNAVRPERLTATLTGPCCSVFNDGGGELSRVAILDRNLETTFDFNFNTELDIAQVTAFYWVSRAVEFTRPYIGMPRKPIRTNVNLGIMTEDDRGNASWDGSALNFFRADPGFPNTALCDYIVHEYGHSVDGRLRGIQSRSYSEGFSDALVILMTQQPIVGRDYPRQGMNERDARDTLTWDGDEARQGAGEAHSVGRVYSCFVWRFLQQLEAANVGDPYAIATSLVMDAAKTNPASVPEAVHAMFLADDDDGNPRNGTRHYDLLARAAEATRLPYPERQ